MRTELRQSGLSLIEETIVIAIVAILLFLAVPAARYLFNNIETPAGVRAMIGSALNSAKAIAAREQRYVGIRFQHACYRDTQGNIHPEESPLKVPQYMIFIIYDNEKTNLVNGFRAVEGVEPIKLPENIGIMDLTLNPKPNLTEPINNNGEIDEDTELTDTTSFSIIFSPAGKLVVRDVKIRNRDGQYNISTASEDDIFNTLPQVEDNVAMFLQDENTYKARFGLDEEPSRRSFIIYDRNILRSIPADERYTRYLEELENKKKIYINPYTGTFINR